MTFTQRLKQIIKALLMLISAVCIFFMPTYGFLFAMLTLSCSLLIRGLSQIGYYISLARYMVGGKSILYQGIILLDIGILALSLSDSPQICVVFYLIGCHFFTGATHLFQALDAKRLGASWIIKYSHGIISILIAVLCIVYIHSTDTLAIIYSLGLFYSSFVYFMTAFRSSTMVYIQ